MAVGLTESLFGIRDSRLPLRGRSFTLQQMCSRDVSHKRPHALRGVSASWGGHRGSVREESFPGSLRPLVFECGLGAEPWVVSRPQGMGRWGEGGRRWWGAWGDDGAEGSWGRCGEEGMWRWGCGRRGWPEGGGVGLVGRRGLWRDGGVLRTCRPCCQLGASALVSGPREGVQRGCVMRGRLSCPCGLCPPACPACGARALRALSSPKAPRSSTATSLRPRHKPSRARYGRAAHPVQAGS